MRDDSRKQDDWTFEACRYGSSRLTFRGPPRSLSGPHIAFIGSNETVAKQVEFPYPALLEAMLGEVCINLGQTNASVDAFQNDTLVPNVCRDALVTVMAVMGAANMSNRLYSVHPRRNDRFIKPSASLRALYPDVDFHEICFVRHLLSTLHATSPKNFEVVRQELREAWIARMRTFLDRIGPNVILLWITPETQGDATGSAAAPVPLGEDPLFVTRSMVEAVRSLARDVVSLRLPRTAEPNGLADVDMHHDIAEALLPSLQAALGRAHALRA